MTSRRAPLRVGRSGDVHPCRFHTSYVKPKILSLTRGVVPEGERFEEAQGWTMSTRPPLTLATRRTCCGDTRGTGGTDDDGGSREDRRPGAQDVAIETRPHPASTSLEGFVMSPNPADECPAGPQPPCPLGCPGRRRPASRRPARPRTPACGSLRIATNASGRLPVASAPRFWRPADKQAGPRCSGSGAVGTGASPGPLHGRS